MDPAQALEMGTRLLALASQFAPLAEMASRVGVDGALKAVRAVSGIDSKLQELGAQQHANAEADKATLERVAGLERAVGELTLELRRNGEARAVTASRLQAVEHRLGELVTAASHQPNGGA